MIHSQRGFRIEAAWTWAMVAAMVLGFATLAAGATTVVTTKDGRTFEGELVRQNDRQVVLKISGIETPISRVEIDKVTTKASPREQYEAARAKIADDDYGARYRLADRMYKQGALEQANRELTSLLQDQPDFRRAKLLKMVVDQRLKLQNESKRNKNQPASAGRGGGAGANPPGRANPAAPRDQGPFKSPKDLLSADQINLIRLWELPQDLSTMGNRIVVPRQVVDKLLENHRDEASLPKGRRDQLAFRREPDWKQLDAIFAIKARELYKEVQIRQDPPSLQTYRRLIAPSYANHYFYQHFGQGQVQGLRMVPPNGFSSTTTAYTNFYLLSKFHTAQADMIDHQNPTKSLLLQWGLPRDSATYPAPEVPGWRPFFRSPEDPNFQRFVRWITSLYPKPDYGIDYQVPGSEGGDDSGNRADANNADKRESNAATSANGG